MPGLTTLEDYKTAFNLVDEAGDMRVAYRSYEANLQAMRRSG